MFGLSNIFKSKSFDFAEYLIERGYVLKHDEIIYKVFQKEMVLIYVYEKIEQRQNKMVSINVLDSNVATLSFIPKSRTMFDILLNQIRIDIIENDDFEIKTVE